MRSRENLRGDRKEVVTYSIRSIRCCNRLRWIIHINDNIYNQAIIVDDTDAAGDNRNGFCH